MVNVSPATLSKGMVTGGRSPTAAVHGGLMTAEVSVFQEVELDNA